MTGRLADELAIRDLVFTYARGVDRKDLDQVAGCFTPDCVYDGALARGTIGDALERLRGAMDRYARTMHFMGTQTVDVDGDRARTVTDCIAYHVRPDGGLATVAVRYRDALVRTAEGWRIGARVVETDWTRADPPTSIPVAP